METTKPKAGNIAIKWAVINVLTSIVITYAFQFLNVDPNSPSKYLGFIPFIAFLLLAQKEYRDQLGGFMTFGEGFVSGFLFSVFAGILSAIFLYFYYTILSPQVYEQILTAAQTQLQEKGMSSDQIEKAMDISRKYGAIFTTVGAVFGSAIIGAIIALIGAAILKKERSLSDVEDSSTYTDPVS